MLKDLYITFLRFVNEIATGGGDTSHYAVQFEALSYQLLGAAIELLDGRPGVVDGMEGFNAKVGKREGAYFMWLNVDALLKQGWFDNLFTLCHELGHVALKHTEFDDAQMKLYDTSRQFYIEVEDAADEWAYGFIEPVLGGYFDDDMVVAWLNAQDSQTAPTEEPPIEHPAVQTVEASSFAVDAETVESFLSDIRKMFPNVPKSRYGTMAMAGIKKEVFERGVESQLHQYLKTVFGSGLTTSAMIKKWYYSKDSIRTNS